MSKESPAVARTISTSFDSLAQVLDQRPRVALLVGNGINRFSNDDDSSWEGLLAQIAEKQKVELSEEALLEMSNTELFDILDLAKPVEDRSNLQQMFCGPMGNWKPAPHHSRIVGWAQRHAAPIITVNFDENLSKGISAKFFRQCSSAEAPRFTDIYPWRSYFGVQEIDSPADEFGIWHVHGMMRYSRSIRLGLTHYMGSVHRARAWIYRGENSLIHYLRGKSQDWNGMHTWLHALLFSDIAIFGFGFGKDEVFLRWLFLERARLHKRFPSTAKKAWFVTEDNSTSLHKRPFFEHLGIELVVETRDQIYECPAWDG